MVGNPSTRILIDRVEEVFRSTKQTDDRNARAQGFQILGKKFLPQLFAKSEQEDCRRGDRDVPFEAEIIPYLVKQTHRPNYDCSLLHLTLYKSARIST